MGKGGGPKRAKGKKRKSQWDDEPSEASGGRADAAPRRGESMMGQWKRQKQRASSQRRQFAGSVAERKQQQRVRVDETRARLAASAFEEKAARMAAAPARKPRRKSGVRRRRRRKAGGEEEESESESEEEEPERAKASVFDQFVKAFKPEEEDDSEEEEEDEYEEVLVDEHGNEVHEEDDEQEEEAGQEEDVAQEEEEEEAADDEVEAVERAEDPYRQRYQLLSFSEREAKVFEAEPRKFKAVTGASETWPSEYAVAERPGLAKENAEVEEETALQFVRSRLRDAWAQKGLDADALWPRGTVERALFTNMLAYRDILFAAQTLGNTKALRRMSAMHVLNHVLKSRDTVTRNNERIRKRTSGGDDGKDGDDEEEKEYRDQGFCRASVLVMLPLRSSAVSFVNLLMELLPTTVDTFHNKDRFYNEYGENEGEDDAVVDDDDDRKEWQRVFSTGNNDDCFQIGLSLSRRSMRFYSEYHHADIIIASPLGLRQQLGDEIAELDDDEEDKKLSTDILSSIEVCVVDSASLISMQNVDHLRAVLRAVNAPPKEAPHADFSRLREWNLGFLGAYFRQTVVFAHGIEPLLNALISKSCRNIAGCMRIARRYDAADGSASISHVVPRVQQIFQRVDMDGAATATDEAEARFAYFKKHVFEPLLDHPRKHVLILIPSYFDYVRVRNLFNEPDNRKLLRCLQCCEYTPNSQVARARTAFFHGKCNVLLVTERFHFYHQYRLRGIRQLVWYAPPAMGDFYAELLNMLPGSTGENEGEEGESEDEEDESGKSSITLFSRRDLFSLQRVVGDKRAERMCHPKAPKPTFLFA